MASVTCLLVQSHSAFLKQLGWTVQPRDACWVNLRHVLRVWESKYGLYSQTFSMAAASDAFEM